MAQSGGHTFGQRQPPLYVAIQKILEKYPDGQIFKEIIQNADDAGASTVHFYLDNRQHGTQSLVEPQLARFQGPSLLAYNDAIFQEKDWQSIQDLQQSVKAEDPFKVGKFGIGFNSVYHITDLPTILSGERLAYLEPHEEIWRGESGQWYSITDSACKGDTLASFDGLRGFSVQSTYYGGTIFRFPLRNEKREKRVSSHVYDISKLRFLLTALRKEAKYILLFLRSVRTVEVFEIAQNGTHLNLFKVSIQETPEDRLSLKRSLFQQQLESAFQTQSFSISHPIELVVQVRVHVTDHLDQSNSSQSKWLIASRVGSQFTDVHKTAQTLKVFSRVGVALETGPVETSDSGRVFCVLPMPPEVCCNLPVHVNGTFSLNDERRALKWQGLEARNDDKAKWNDLIVTRLLPPCYAALLLQHAKMLLKPEDFYRAWPNVQLVRDTHWEGLLRPLFSELFSQAVVWSHGSGGLWVKVSSATFAPRDNPLPDVVSIALLACGEKVVTAPSRVWDALEHSGLTLNTITPHLARAKLRQSPASYSTFSYDQKLELLEYCLSDGAYYDLSNLVLLPLANGTFTLFRQSSRHQAPVYLCSSQCPRYLLPNLDGELVDIDNDGELYAKLKDIADSGYTQLQVLTSKDVASLLPRSMPQKWQYQQVVTLPHPEFPIEWLEKFWEWILPQTWDLKFFSNKLVIPILCSQSSALALTRLNHSSPCVFVPSNTNCSPYLISALTKLQVRCCLQSTYPYVQHYQLLQLMNSFSADGVLDAIGHAKHYNVSLTTEEARHLRTCLVNWTQGGSRSATLQALPIFTTLPNSGEQLHSVAQVKTRSLSRTAQMAPTYCPLSTRNFPSALILFSSSDFYQQQILHNLYEVSTTTTIDMLISSIFPHIQEGHMTASCTQSLMKEVLENTSEVTSGATLEKKKKLKSWIAKLPFLPVSSGSLKKPESLFSPSEPELQDLYQNEPVFPVEPFLTKKCLNVLNACGLKTTVSPQEIVEIIKAISSPASNQPQAVDTTRYSRAKAVLDYISQWDKKKMSEVVTTEVPSSGFWGGVGTKRVVFSQALKDLSQNKCWLPVQAKLPGEYPGCLGWKGSDYTCHFISFGPSVLLHHNQNSFPLACGSQMYFVDHSLSLEICKVFAPDMHQVSRNIMQHLERVITDHDQILDMRTITRHIYTLLHDSYSNRGCSIQLSWMQSTQECVWISRCRRFVHPHVVAIRQNPSFRHNLEPFIYTLPDDLEEFSSLFEALGVVESVSRPQIMGILEKIKEEDSVSLKVSDDDAWQLVMNILNWLTGSGAHMADMSDCDTLYVPVEPDSGWPTLVKSEDVVYTDNDFLKCYLSASGSSEYSFKFVNHRVSTQMAHQLRLRPLSECLDISEDAFEDVGQSEPLTVRLKNILKDYKDGLTIVKEMLQNADDAGATEMNICYDARQHTEQRESLFFPGMAECHGPALIVHNNAMFSQDDFKNITKLAGATKAGKALKIGKFGVGFCSVYHITDIPSFVSDELLYIFDPTLTYLKDEIKNPASPGKKVTFTSRFISQSSQLAPYQNVFGFNPQHSYEGTMFRFPFRTTTSELSGKIYTEKDVKELISEIEHSSSKLLLFLQSINCLTFVQFDNNGTCSRELVKITKTTQSIGSRSIHQVTCTCSGSPSATDYWLVETCTETALKRCSTASVACSLLPVSTTDHFRVKVIEGEMFCFLPLSMKTGLPVHVSSNFAVSNNRRGIWTSDDESRNVKEVEWNKTLMKQVIPTAYYKLLEALKDLCDDSKLDEYVFYSLWPLQANLKTHNPWSLLIHKLYSDHIASSELFFSVSTDQWLSLANSRFLATDILRQSSMDDSAVSDEVLNVVNYLKLPVVHLPEKYHAHLTLGSSVVTENVFLQTFFSNIGHFDSIVDSRNHVLCLALEAFANELDQQKERYVYLKGYLENNACVPCVPDGQLLRKCSKVIHPRADFSKLFDPEEKLFPLDQFCNRNLVEMAMKRLGMIHDIIPMCLLVKRAHTVSTLYEKNAIKALERVKLILKYISMQESSVKKDDDSGIANVPLLPVMPKPGDYPLSWCGEKKRLLPGRQLMLKGKISKYGQTSTNVYIAGSQVSLVYEVEPKDGGCGYLTYVAKGVLRIRSSPTPKEVIAHFKHLIEVFTSERTPSTRMIEWAGAMARQVYEYLDSALKPHILQGTETHQSVDLSPVSDLPCIWTGKKFMHCDNIAQDWKLIDGPCLFRVPSSIVTRTNLLKALEIKEKFTINDFLRALLFLHKEYSNEQLPDNCQRLVKEIITELVSCSELPNDHPIMLPDTTFVMHEASQLAFNDAQWLPPEAGYTYVNDTFITRDVAKKLGVKMVRSKRLDKYRSQTRHFKGAPFGQHEELTRRIQNILRDYPFDVTILKELLQNADDAKATKMYVILDERMHSTERVLSENWHELQGPALLVWNDSEFTEQDLEGIQKLGLGSKRSESETIGQYGIGFNAVYHLTDCPSFVTGGNTLCILDPHCKYAPEADVEFPGERFDGLDTGFWDEFPDMKSAYLHSDLQGCPQELSKGTLFRFPLRHLPKLLCASNIIDRSSGSFAGVLSAAKMHSHLKRWAPKMKQSMFFLNNVTEIKFFTISERLNMEHCYRVSIDQTAIACRKDLHSKIAQFTKAQGSEPFVTKYQLTLEELPSSGEKHREQKWLVQQGIGDVENKSQNWQFIEQVKPRHGLAAPLYHTESSESFRGNVFCFLPLPVSCNLPVHVNGHFILDSNRRGLWKATNIDEPDDKQQWNVHLMKAIASSYAHFLVSAKADYLGTSETVRFKDIQRYYDVFPRWRVPRPSHSPESKLPAAAPSSRAQSSHPGHDVPGMQQDSGTPKPASVTLSTHSKHDVPVVQRIFAASKAAVLRLTDTTVTKSASSSSALPSGSPMLTVTSSLPSHVPSPQVPTNEWLEMAKNVFRTLAENNAPILAVIDHKTSPKHPPHGKNEAKEDKKNYTVEWYPLKAAEEWQTLQVYFATSKEDVALKVILARIGMKITCAFGWIRKQFEDVGTVVPVLSPTEVYKYYSQFHAQIHISSSSFPCPIGHTLFKSAEDFKRFTKYVLIQSEKSSYHEFPEPAFELPLLLTADGNLRCFSSQSSSKVVKSEYSSVFPQRLQHFLHPTLVDVPYSPNYFLAANSEQDTTACSQVIEELLASILPRSLKTSCVQSTVSKETLKRLWKCLSLDPLFSYYLKDILKQWAFLLSCDNKLYSCPSLETVLPIIPLQASEGSEMCDISNVLEKELKLPFLETDIVPVGAVMNICPRFSDPETILQVLYCFHYVHDISQLVSKSVSKTLINYFSNIHLKKSTECVRYVRELPLFLTANGNLTSLSGKTAYIWPYSMCAEGQEIWLKDLNVVFLDMSGAWRSLGLESELQISWILPIEIYTKFIFVRYDMMSEALRYKHLRHIRDQLFGEAMVHSQNEKSEKHSQSHNFISALKCLKCIGSDGENLRSVQELYDHEEIIFATFEDNFSFLPICFRKGEETQYEPERSEQEEEDLREYHLWRTFFKKLSLHCTITTSEFLTLCREVANDVHKKNTRRKSNVLRDFLFTEKAAWSGLYDKKHKRSLSEVANIPFVCAEKAKKLTWITPVPKTTTVIQAEEEDISLTTFSGACVSKHSELVWSIRPIISPSYYGPNDAYYLQKLMVKYPPDVEDVVQHIVNISRSGFADPKLFDTYSVAMPPKGHTHLTSVMAECFGFLDSNIERKAEEHVISKLSTTPCIPVPAQKVQETGTVLVKPHQVLYVDEAEEYHPFMHKLPTQLRSSSALLEKIGVKSSLQLSHLQTVLQMAHDQLQACMMDPNIQRIVMLAIDRIQGMLTGGQVVRMKGEIEVAKQLKPLYLPGHDKKLHDSSVLIYPDTFSYRNCCLNFENTQYFQFHPPFIPSTELYTFTDEFCGILPTEVRPQPMSEVCLQKLSMQCTPLEENIEIAKKLKATLNLPMFPKACFKILKHASPNHCDKSLEPILAELFKGIIVHTVDNLKVDIALRQHQQVIGTAKVDLFIQQGNGHTELYLDSRIPNVLRSYVYDQMTQELIVTLKNVCCTLPGSVFSHNTLQGALRMLLEAENLQDIQTVFQQHKIRLQGTDLGVPELSPVVGQEIPPELHYLLDQNILNIFHSQELVGYELTEGHIIFAEVIHIVLPDDFDPQESNLDLVQMKYKIRISESDEEGKTVSSLDIYKFLNIPKHDPSVESFDDQRLVPHEGGGDASSQFQSARDAKRNLCQVLKQIWKLSEPERNKAIRRLFLKWHPDKNPDNPQLAEEVFKFLLRQLERLKQGLEPEEEEEEDTSANFSPSPYWSSYFDGWSSTARSHGRHRRHHREYYRNESRYSSGGSYGFGGRFYNYEQPRSDPDRARQWVQQAEIDSEALDALLRSAHTNPRLASHVCFMAHEVAEKALKGGMYATCGLGANSLTKHDISPLAHALRGERRQIAAELPSFTIPLESHYLNTRFPNRYSPPTVPSDRYSLSDAQEAQMNATNILAIVKQILSS